MTSNFFHMGFDIALETAEAFLFATPSNAALELTQPHMQKVWRSLFLLVKWPARVGVHSPRPIAD
jgi:hypothetical protein